MKRILFLITLTYLFSLRAAAATAGFLTIPSLPGDSVDIHHPGAIDVVDVQITTDRVGATTSAASLSVTRYVDRLSPTFSKFAALGVVVPQATLAVRKLGEQTFDYYLVALENAQVVSCDHFLKDGVLMETITFSPTKVTWTFVPQKVDGNAGDPITESATIGKTKT